MAENLPALIVAKVKAVGLIAGTAMVTTALVGGGAVAVTVVGNDKPHGPAVVDELVVDADAAAAARGAEQRSDTAPAAIEHKGKPDQDEDGEDKGCGREVSAVASAKEAGTPGHDHGKAVSATARECNGSLGAGDARGRSADRPADPGRSGEAGRPDTGPGSPGFVGSKGAGQGRSQGKSGSQGKAPDRD